ncbi:MAG: phytoene/squalene synthase family protein [Planctomycetota bacterium]
MDLERAYQHCHEVVAARAKNFVYSFWLLPPARRRGLEAIYAYCRLADDFADDDALPTEERARLLADLRARLRAALPQDGDPPPPALAPSPELDPVMLALGDTAARFGVRRHDLDQVAVGCEQDLVKARYANWGELRDYCYLVASCVGLGCLDVFGYRGEPERARALATDLGLAMQLTNVIRDVREDLERDRIYLPMDELQAHGVSEEALRAGRVDDAWRGFCRAQVQRARDLFAQAAPLTALVQRRSRICPIALATIYQAVLRQVEANDYDVFSRRASLGSGRKLALLGNAMASTAFSAATE